MSLQNTVNGQRTRLCKDCGGVVSKSARRCPHCGSYHWSEGRIGGVVFIFLFFGLVLMGGLSYKSYTSPQGTQSLPAVATAPASPEPTLASTENERIAVSQSLGYAVVSIVGRIVAIYVRPTMTTDGVEKIIHAFQDGRKSGTLSRLLPPTTGGEEGGYGEVLVAILSDREKATEGHVARFARGSGSKQDDRAFTIEYLKHVRGYYHYKRMPFVEKAVIFVSQGKKRPPKSKQLF